MRWPKAAIEHEGSCRSGISSREPPVRGDDSPLVALGNGEFRVGAQGGPTDLRIVIGHCSFTSTDADMLASLLPQLVTLVGDESRAQRPAREVVLSRLLKVLFIQGVAVSG